MLTEEQVEVVESDSEALGVVAFAGAGKTTTLKAYADARPNQKILYLAFNKAIQEEATKKFPANVECITTHALAFQQVGRKFQHKLKQSVRPNAMAMALGLNDKDKNRYYEAKKAESILLKFLSSPDRSFDIFAESQAKKFSQKYLNNALKLWTLMIDPENSTMPMLHDGYLKLFQLQSPTLDYDTILFDEAQDANPVTLDIVRNQSASQIYVGDPHQQIYSFRNAVNAMNSDVIKDRLYLTETFRFGEHIADVANGILQIKRETRKIIGHGHKDKITNYAYITRGNAAIYERAVTRMEESQGFHVIGGIEGIQLNLLEDIWKLKYGEKSDIRDKYIKSFEDFDDLTEQSSRTDERDIKSWCGVITRHLSPLSIPDQIAGLRTLHHPSPQSGDLILTTTHKSKGLEFGSVELGNDFPSAELLEEIPPGNRTPSYPLDWEWGPHKHPSLWINGKFKPVIALANEEINLRYVAVTRAETVLKPIGVEPPFNRQRQWLIKNPSFQWLESMSDLPRDTVEQKSLTAPADLNKTIDRWIAGYQWNPIKGKHPQLETVLLNTISQNPGYNWGEIFALSQQALAEKKELSAFFRHLHVLNGWTFFHRVVLEFLVKTGSIRKSMNRA